MSRRRYKCGCETEVVKHGASVSRIKCNKHAAMMQDVGELGYDYYARNGVFVDHVPQCPLLINQFIAGFGELANEYGNASVLEIGCGCSMYVPHFLKHGYNYSALEPSLFASKWTSSTFNVPVHRAVIETFVPTQEYDAILAAHCLEHMADAPAALCKMRDMLVRFGTLYLIIPNDDDMLNPDHLWFFSDAAIRAYLADAGFEVKSLKTFKYIEREHFMYIEASKQ